MIQVKINKKGQITIPKSIRNKYGLTAGITLSVNDYDGKLVIEPAIFCHHCKKVLPDEFREINACPDCPPAKTIKLY